MTQWVLARYPCRADLGGGKPGVQQHVQHNDWVYTLEATEG